MNDWITEKTIAQHDDGTKGRWSASGMTDSQIKDIEDEMAKTQKNKNTEYVSLQRKACMSDL